MLFFWMRFLLAGLALFFVRRHIGQKAEAGLQLVGQLRQLLLNELLR